MNVVRNPIDSEVFGNVFLDIQDFEAACDFASLEQEYRKEHDPIYVGCKVPMEDLESIARLEEEGFRLVECQLRASGRIRKPYDTTSYRYEFLPVSSDDADLATVLDIAGSTIVHDRFTVDPFFQRFHGRNLSGERFRRYVMRSVHAGNEHVGKLCNKETGEVCGFGTYRIVAPGKGQLLLGGIKAEYKGAGLGLVNDYLSLNSLLKRNVTSFVTHFSAINYPILGLEVSTLGLRIVQSFAVLRKVYV